MEDALLNLTPAAIVVVGARGLVAFANAGAVRLFGSDLVGLVLDELVSPLARDAFAGYRAALSATEPPMTMSFDAEFRHADGPRVKQRIRALDLASAQRSARIIMEQSDSTRIAELLDELNAGS